MNLPKTWVVLLALLLAGMAMVPIVSADDASTQSSASSLSRGQTLQPASEITVNINEAESLALYNVRELATKDQELSLWSDATVELATTYYDIKNQKTAYAFNVLNDGQYAGYILISATTDKYPVLELSKGRIPGSDPEIAAKSRATISESLSEGKEIIVSDYTPVYLGGLDYYQKYTVKNLKTKKNEEVFVDVHSSKIVNISDVTNAVPDKNTPAQWNTYQKEKQDDIRKSWSLQRQMMQNGSVANMAVSARSTLSYTNTISGVPIYFWTRGCSPTAAAMVLGYWHDHGYPSLPLSTTLINAIADKMATDPSGSTWPFNIGYGVNQVLNTYQYYSLRASDDYVPTWSRDVAEIDASRPFVLSMYNGGTGAGRSTPYGDHSVTCIGYMDSTPQLLKIYDTWEGSTYHWLQYNNWGWAMNTYVR